MKIPQFIQVARKTAEANAPAILTGIGITGTVATAYLTGKASFEAARLLDQDARDREIFEQTNPGEIQPRTRKDEAKLIWQLYLPAAGAGGVTIGAIYFANRISSKRLAALAAAYTIAEKANTEYKDKVLEMMGKDKEEKVRAAVQQDRVDRDPDLDGQIDHELEDGLVRCKDAWSSRYFRSSMEDLKAAQNYLNHQALNHGYVSLTDLYCQLGLEKTKDSDDIGWNSDKLLEMTFTSAIDSKKRPVLVMDFAVPPVPNYWKSKF